MRTETTQEDRVYNKNLENDEVPPESVTEALSIPGLKELHKLDRDSMAETLKSVFLNTLKSRPDLIAFTYTVGKGVQVTYRPKA